MMQNEFNHTSVHPTTLWWRMLLGAGIGFLLISTFLFTAPEFNPQWPEYWYIRPLLVVPIAGAFGGAWDYVLDRFKVQGGWQRIGAIALSLLGFLLLLWLGSVLGLNGTFWD